MSGDFLIPNLEERMTEEPLDFLAALDQEPAPMEEEPEVEPADLVPAPTGLPALPTFDTAAAAAMLERITQEFNLMVERAKKITIIKDNETNELAVRWASQAKKLY